MKITGTVFSAVGRGLVTKYHARLIGLLGFRPHTQTLHIKLASNLDSRTYAKKTIEHVLTDGKPKVDAFLIPVVIKVSKHNYMVRGFRIEGDETVTTYKWKKKDAFALRREGKFLTWDIIRGEADRRLIESLKRAGGKKSEFKLDSGRESSEAWAIRTNDDHARKNELELIFKNNLRDELLLQDDDLVEIEIKK